MWNNNIIGGEFEIGIDAKREYSLTIINEIDKPSKVLVKKGNHLEFSLQVEDIFKAGEDIFYKCAVFQFGKPIGISYIESDKIKWLGMKRIGNA